MRDRGLRAAPPDVISKACVFGGATTVVDFANWRPGIDLPQAIEEKDRLYRGHSYADYTVHAVLVGMGTEGATPERGVPLPLEVIAVTSANAAKILGMYPKKGAMAPGSDADIAVTDPGIRKRRSLGDLHAADHSVWEGWEIHGWPVTTILRGKVIVDDGKLLGDPGDGRLIGARETAPEILQRPAC